MKFRHELKYLINYGEAELLKERLAPLMQTDSHTVDGKYSIRSLYFDDWWNSGYNDKIGGYPNRKKYRIRLYNNDDSFIRLECKIKQQSYISKISAPLTASEVDMILRGEYGFLLKSENNLCRRFYYECTSRVMRPKVYVDYEREPYVLDAGDVRITFDSDVRGAYPSGTVDGGDKVFYHVLEPGKLVLEVKYTEFLPGIIKQVLPMRSQELTAVSKYTLCCDKIHYLSANDSEL